MNMKNSIVSKLNWIAKGLALAGLALAALPAQAELINGYYTGRLPNYNLDSEVYVQGVQHHDGKTTFYGIIFAKNDADNKFGAIFRITELPNGLQSWVQMFQNEAGQLTSEPGQRPTYAVRTVYDGQSWRDAHLQFTVTDFGRELGCVDPVTDAEIRFGFLGTGTTHLVPMPAKHFKIESRRDVSAYYDNGVLTGSFSLGSKEVQGDFQIVPKFFGSIGELRQGTPDPESESITGVSEKRELIGAIVATRSHALIAPKNFFHIIEIPSITEIGKRKDLCFGHVNEINED
jgi:hypothetical protein